MDYTGQKRGSADSYSSYYAGMDKTMRQKVALICSHFPASGKIADMGSGSGRGSWDLANLYPDLEVVGVDISPESVDFSRREFSRSNLSFLLGDIADRIFEPGSMDGFLNSSVLHHVTSFNGFSLEKVLALLDHQTQQLRTGGILAIRDFVIPEGPAQVALELPNDDGKADGNYEELSSAALFERFCQTFRCADYPESGIPFKMLSDTRFAVDLRRATEFILRKDYRKDWEPELREEYLYFSQKRFEEEFRKRGLRILLSRPIYNRWIISNRWENKIRITDLEGHPLPFPPTNYMIVGEKVDPGAGVELRHSTSRVLDSPRFLQIESFRERDSGAIWDLVSRPYPTLDLIPWFEIEGELHVVARSDYPRPIVQARNAELALEDLRMSGFIVEPITLGMPKDPAEEIPRFLSSLGLVQETSEPGLEFFPSPGSVGELVQQRFVKVKPVPDFTAPFACHHGFKSAARVRALPAQQTLRAYQAGGMIDHRLELGIYALLRLRQGSPGPWIGEELGENARVPSAGELGVSLADGINSFEPCTKRAGFLEARAARFAELDRDGRPVAEIELEYVQPATRSLETVIALPYTIEDGTVWVGTELRKLPAVQKFSGSARLICLPAWRLTEAQCRQDARATSVPELLLRDFGITSQTVYSLGSPYFPSPGTTPEVCSAFGVRVAARGGKLNWIPLGALLKNANLLRSGHLLIAAFRLSHALLHVAL